MSIKYELSLWRDYPGAQGMQEEKGEILAATDMTYVGRAQNIVLTRSYNGQDTLSFEIPVKVTEGETGKLVQNELIGKIHNKSKIKLWRDELWYNPYAIEGEKDSITGVVSFIGQWQQGRWYEFIVTTINEGRGKKKLTHEFTCDALYVNELSRTGYGLEFEPDTDIMSASGMGTAHELGKRILDGSGWEYVKTEVFPDYEEKFNPKTGETIKIPVATDQIEFMNGLKQYGYCYRVKVDTNKDENGEYENNTTQKIVNIFKENDLQENVHYRFNSDGELEWKPRSSDDWKNYVYNYTKTISNAGIPKMYIGQDSADMFLYKKTTSNNSVTWENGRVGVNNFSNIDLWKAEGSAVPASISTKNVPANNSDDTTDFQPGYNRYYLELGRGIYANTSCIDKTFETAQRLALRISTTATLDITVRIYSKADWDEGKNPTLEMEIEPNSSFNSQENVYWIQISKQIKNPVIVLQTQEPIKVYGFYLWDLIAYDDEILSDEKIVEKMITLPKDSEAFYGKLSNLLSEEDIKKEEDGDKVEINKNLIIGSKGNSYIWCPPGVIKGGGTAAGVEQYLCEFYKNGEYIDVYLPINESNVKNLEKISTYNTDKRRTIQGSKSNRYSLLETVAETFYCFTRFIINHDTQGKVIGQKKITFCEDLGRNQFNGFNYGVNLVQINRTVDATNLVTKMYVDNIDNQYSNSGLISIGESSYNGLHENFIYNFEYYINRGLIDKTKFLRDYQNLVNEVGPLNLKILEEGEILVQLNEEYSSLSSTKTVLELTIKALKESAKKELETLKWQLDPHGNLKPFPKIAMDFFYDVGSGATRGPAKDIKELANLIYAWGPGLGRNDCVGAGHNVVDIEASLNVIFNAQTAYVDNEKRLNEGDDSIRNQVNNIKNKVDLKMEEISQLTKRKNRLIETFEKKYIQYIIEGVWKGDKYIDPNPYYLDATRTMATSCMPKVSYKMSVLDLSQISNPLNPEDKNWGEDFIYDVGDTTYVKDEELFGLVEQKAMVAEKTIYVDADKPDDIELQNYETRFEELFKSISATVTTLSMNENIYSRAANFDSDGAIDSDILQKSFTKNKELVISSANNSVVQDNRGLIITNTDGTGEILRAIAGGIYFSKDNGVTYTLGVSADGINASLITAGQIDTSKIVIRSSGDPKYSLNELGLTAHMDKTVDKQEDRENSFVRFDRHGIYMTKNGAIFNYQNWWKTGDFADYIITTDVNWNSEKSYYINDNDEWCEILQSHPYFLPPNDIFVQLSNGPANLKQVNTTSISPLQRRTGEEYIVYEKNKKSAVQEIRDRSIFSLTEKGLLINSTANGTAGSMQISTEHAILLATDSEKKNRVKIGYIRTEDTGNNKKDIYGIDIYDGAFRLYGDEYRDGLSDSDASIYFNENTMIISANFIKKFEGTYLNQGKEEVYYDEFHLSSTKDYFPDTEFNAEKDRPSLFFKMPRGGSWSYSESPDGSSSLNRVIRETQFFMRPNLNLSVDYVPAYELSSDDTIGIRAFMPSGVSGAELVTKFSSCWLEAYANTLGDLETLSVVDPVAKVQVKGYDIGHDGEIDLLVGKMTTAGAANGKIRILSNINIYDTDTQKYISSHSCGVIVPKVWKDTTEGIYKYGFLLCGGDPDKGGKGFIDIGDTTHKTEVWLNGKDLISFLNRVNTALNLGTNFN